MAAAGSDEHDYLPISERPEWAGVRPLAPPPTPSPVVAIARDPLQGDLMDYFWAAVARGELRWVRGACVWRATLGARGGLHMAQAHPARPAPGPAPPPCLMPRPCPRPAPGPRSERVLGLTGEIISDLNSSNYTVWEWRWRCVEVRALQVGCGVWVCSAACVQERCAGCDTANVAGPRVGVLQGPLSPRCAGAGRRRRARGRGAGPDAQRGHRQPQELSAVEPPAAAGAGAGRCGARRRGGRGGAERPRQRPCSRPGEWQAGRCAPSRRPTLPTSPPLPPPPSRCQQEMAFTAACLAHDAKNYHAWAHRQALLLAASAEAGGGAGGGGAATAAAAAVAGLWSAELAFTERLLREDVRNNSGGWMGCGSIEPAWPPGSGRTARACSPPCPRPARSLPTPALPTPLPSAWNQRIFVLRNAPPAAVGLPAEAYAREVEFAAAQARTAPHSESAWEVLRELAGGPGAPPHALASDARYLAACREVLDAAPGCSPALALLADVLLAQAALLGEAAEAAAAREGGDGAGKAAAASGAPPLDRRHAAAAAVEARRLARLALERLAATDPLRRPFWRLELAALA